jgi:hypothetical protein
MAELTRLQIKEYVRSVTGVLDSDRINDNTLNEDINLAQRKIQLDLLALGSKKFTKFAYNEGFIFDVPSDMLFHPNAIIDIEASSGARATESLIFTGSSGTPILTLTLKEAGLVGIGDITVFFESISGYNTPSLYSYDFDYNETGAWYFVIRMTDAQVTITEMLALFSTNPILKHIFTASFGSASGTVTLTVANPDINLSGTGGIQLPAEEKDIQEFNRVVRNSFLKATVNEPIYRRVGSEGSEPTNQIEFYPRSITYSKMYYYFRLLDLSSDLATTSLPMEMEELLLLDLQRRVYIYLKKQAEDDMKKAELQGLIGDVSQKYNDALAVVAIDKKRIKSEGV